MRVFDILSVLNPDVSPERSKVYLATWNGIQNPLDVYFAGKFDEWQHWQSRRNFEREFVVTLIALPAWNDWLLAGVYRSAGSEWIEKEGLYQYQLLVMPEFGELSGRLVANFTRSGRQSYLNAESLADSIRLSEFLRERLSIGEFPGYRKVDLSRSELEIVVNQSLESWRTALSNVAGIYLISDTASGKLYVGSASGEGGIWQRWSDYVSTGHGGNVELRKLLLDQDEERVQKFRYSVLEITDIHMSEEDVLTRDARIDHRWYYIPIAAVSSRAKSISVF